MLKALKHYKIWSSNQAGEPIYQENSKAQIRKLVLEIIHRLPRNSDLEPHARKIQSIMFRLVEVRKVGGEVSCVYSSVGFLIFLREVYYTSKVKTLQSCFCLEGKRGLCSSVHENDPRNTQDFQANKPTRCARSCQRGKYLVFFLVEVQAKMK